MKLLHLLVVAVAHEDLRGHPVAGAGRPGHLAPALQGVPLDPRQAEVGDLRHRELRGALHHVGQQKVQRLQVLKRDVLTFAHPKELS